MPGPNTNCRCPKAKHQHGTPQCYRSCGCREQECRDAEATAVRNLRKQKAYGRSTNHQVDATPVRQHLDRLIRRGWGVRAISKETGISLDVLSNIVYGRNAVLPTTLRAGTADQILAFTPIATRSKFDGTDTENTDATGSRRRLQALVSLGFSLHLLAGHAGRSHSSFKAILARDRIRVSTANEIKALYDQLWDKQPLPETPAEKQSVTMAKKAAQKNGWLPPMMWDDDHIDDPSYTTKKRKYVKKATTQDASHTTTPHMLTSAA